MSGAKGAFLAVETRSVMQRAAQLDTQRGLVCLSEDPLGSLGHRPAASPRQGRARATSGEGLVSVPRSGSTEPGRRSLEPFLPGEIVDGRYQLREIIAAGGMGTIWLARHVTLHSPVALKVMRHDASLDNPSGHLLREARITCSLRSAHIVQVHDFGFDRGRAYMAMEYLEGESLAARLQRGKRLDLSATQRVISDLARGLERVHQANVVHLDLKPENAFIVVAGQAETVKLLDFGVALAALERSGTDASPFLLGTPLYMSPEQARWGGSIDLRSDIWGLGVIAFECLVGRPAFWGATLHDVLTAIASGRCPVPSESGCAVTGFDAWFARACAHEPARRFGSASEAAGALERLAQS
jgi:eukaryotic-like serine/threonine-protein kinase